MHLCIKLLSYDINYSKAYPNWTSWGVAALPLDVLPFSTRGVLTSASSWSFSDELELDELELLLSSSCPPQLDGIWVFCDSLLPGVVEVCEVGSDGGMVNINSNDNTVLIEPTIRNGSMNPPSSYSHAPTAGPYIIIKMIQQYIHINIFKHNMYLYLWLDIFMNLTKHVTKPKARLCQWHHTSYLKKQLIT